MNTIFPFFHPILVACMALFMAGCTSVAQHETQHTERPVEKLWSPSQKGSDTLTVTLTAESLEAARLQALAQGHESLASRHDRVWQEAVATQASRIHGGTGSLEDRLRQRIRAGLDRTALKGMQIVDETYRKETGRYQAQLALKNYHLKNRWLDRLHALDRKLTHFRHATHTGTEFEQLLALTPALPTLEERRYVRTMLSRFYGQAPTLPNDRMATLMDRQITQLFRHMQVSVDALTAETETHETALRQTLQQSGFQISARRPSLLVRYYLEQYLDPGAAQLIGDLELNYPDARNFASLSQVYESERKDETAASREMFETLGEDLVALVLEEMQQQINTVNDNLNQGAVK